MLRQFMERQEDAKDQIHELGTDVSEQSLLADIDVSEDVFVAVILCLNEMRGPDTVNKHDVIHATEFLDHLDTQGFEIRRKADG